MRKGNNLPGEALTCNDGAMVPDVEAGAFAGAGTLRALFDATDWAATPLGPVESWSPALRAALSVVNGTRFPATLLWGPEHVLLYNEPYAEMIGDKHPAALGRTCASVFPEAMDALTPLFEQVELGGSTWSQDVLLPLERAGYVEDCWFTWSYSPVRGPGGVIEGVLDIAVETTPVVLAERRGDLVASLLAGLEGAVDESDVVARVQHLLAGSEDLHDVEIPLGTAPGPDPVPGVAHQRRGDLLTLDLPQWNPHRRPRHLRARLSDRLPVDASYAEFLRAVATGIGSALDSVAASASERAISEALQRSLLTPPVAGAGLEVAVRYQPASRLAHVGGDWYDCYVMPDGATALMVGDVAGHDQTAAAVMGQLRNMARGVAYAADVWTPSQVLEDVDLAMAGLGMEEVATAVVAFLEPQEDGGHLLHWASAGHPPPVLARDGEVGLLDAPAELLLGIDPVSPRADHQVPLRSGDLVLLYTDGLVERRGADLEEGFDWLVSTVREHAGASPERLCQRLLDLASNRDDDLALLAVRVR